MMEDSDFTQYKAIRRGTPKVSPKTPDFTYEHFPVVCPSCEGTGSIEEDASHMVTFVPVKDERLRPAWTKVKIIVLILIIMCIGGCATYFLYPRTVTIQIHAHQVGRYNFFTSSPWIEFSFVMNVTNQNFFAITLKHLTMQILYVEVIVSNQTFPMDYKVGLRTVKKDLVTMNASYDVRTVGKFIKKECFKNRNYVPQLMVSFAELSYWMHTQHIQSKDDYFFTDCGSMVFPLPTKDTTEITTTKGTTKSTTKSTTNVIKFTSTPRSILGSLLSSSQISSDNESTMSGKSSYSSDKSVEEN